MTSSAGCGVSILCKSRAHPKALATPRKTHCCKLPPAPVCVLEPVRECLAAELKHTAYGGRSFFSRVQVERGSL